MATLKELRIYPLKSGAGISLDQARLLETGLEWDRHWMAATPDGVFLSQRTHPRLALIEPHIGEEELTLRAPRLSPFSLPLKPSGNPTPARVWKDAISALDQGDDAAAWISSALGTPTRLLRVAPVLDRRASQQFAGPNPPPVAFADGFPVLVCNMASLGHLVSRMPEGLPMERFRPNVVLEGLEPFEEDRIGVLHFGAVSLRLVKPCTRCVIPSFDQRTAEPSVNPLPYLRQFRFDKSLMGVTFGENAIVERGVGEVLVRGERCTVTHDA